MGGLSIEEKPTPVPGPRQVVVRMRAVSLNFRDLLVVDGRYDPKMRLPLTPVSDGVGEIIAAGPQARRFQVGARVLPIHVPGWVASGGESTEGGPRGGPSQGVLAEEALFDEPDLVEVPAHLDDVEAACLPCAAVTAWNALYGLANTKPGDKVLVLGTGGVALFALQFAVAGGAEVAITSKDPAKLERAGAMGAEHLINYADDPRWGETAKRIFGDPGADRVIELGGAATLSQSLRAVRRGGDVMLVGSVTGNIAPDFNVVTTFMRTVRMQGVAVGPRSVFESMNKAIVRHALRPVIDHVFDGLESFPDALGYLAEGRHFGKIALRIQ
ncbi:zinc-dependent alcohol dehydrogenase family protein [Rhodopseudomonas palustris]|uniref:zinc-dependent alcohol dehydrogenase family protein n=1 Tax=Rhodopseudomonas palustris TaxID=1076 RepID=UPI001F4756BD|nr:NAD(P)-dependent alcohol dehydrogenase [Rhodopseudomonas palustris]